MDENVEYFIDIQGQAKAIVDANSQLENTAANYQQTEDFLARNIGLKHHQMCLEKKILHTLLQQ